MTFLKKLNLYALLASFFAFFGISSTASATVLTDAQTAIAAASGDALTVGGYVVAAVAALIVISLILSMIRKL